jgi:hypothetical protein
MTGRGMYHKTRGFIDENDGRVFAEDFESHRFRLKVGGLRGRNPKEQQVPCFESVTRFAGSKVYLQVPVSDERLNSGSGKAQTLAG